MALGDAGERSETYLRSTDPNPREEALGAEMGRRLEAALAELPVKQRTVFLMARYDTVDLEIVWDTVQQNIPGLLETVRERLSEIEEG